MNSYFLRSSGIITEEMEQNGNVNNEIIEDLDKLDQLLKPVEANLNALRKSFNDIRNHFDDRLKRQQRTIANLLTRMEAIERRLAYSEHCSALHERKLDDLEQVSRKVNLKFCGIEVGFNDSPQKLMEKITDEYSVVNGLELQHSDFDRCHRVGRKYKKNNKTCQDVLLKMCSWKARDTIFKNRKRFSFFVKADMTTRREALFTFAKKEVESSSGGDEPVDDDVLVEANAIGRTVNYVFIDENCKLKLKSKSGKFFMFNSKEEFYNIISRLDNDEMSSPEFLDDEESSELYY